MPEEVPEGQITGESSPAVASGSFLQLNVAAMFDRIARLVRGDVTVFDELREDGSATLGALIVPVAVTLLSAAGAWLWLIIDFDGIDSGRIFLRMFLLGSLFMFLLWLAWVLLVEVVLSRLYQLTVNREALVRCMGYAAAPGALGLLMLITGLSFGIALVSIVAWFALTEHAIRAAVPGVAPAQAMLANLAGFVLFAVVLSVLGHSAGMAAGAFVHAGGVNEYYSYSSFF